MLENPAGRPSLENFLDGDRLGTCEHFATAGALLARACGLPSRIAFGYAGGAAIPSRRSIVFGKEDFHAWTEIHVPDRGWVVLECTPPGQGANRPPRIPLNPDAAEDAHTHELADLPANTLRFDARTVLLAGAGCFLLAWTWARLRRQRRSSPGLREGTDAPILHPGYFAHFIKCSAAIGLPRLPGSTAREHLERIEQAEAGDPILGDLVAYYYRTRYEGNPTVPDLERRFQHQITAWRRRQAKRQTDAALKDGP